MACVLCGHTPLTHLGMAGVRPKSVTSDSRPCHLPAWIWLCGACGHLQKVPDAPTRAAIAAMYDNYEAHHLSKGREQLTFLAGESPRPRSQRALEQLVPLLPRRGRLLDVGTGAGAILASAHALLPEWELYGFDVSERRRRDIERLPQVQGFFSGDLSGIPPLEFDLVVLWHVLEHLNEPGRTLRDLFLRLSDRGRVLIQVPDLERNAFDLAVIDHASHFSTAHLTALARACGFAVEIDGSPWFHNCLTLVLRRAGAEEPFAVTSPSSGPESVDWLKTSVRYFDEQIGPTGYAIFGTGMGGIWLADQLSHAPFCFVDEDESRWGQTVASVPIVGPGTLPASVPMLMSFNASTGMAIAERLRREHPHLRAADLIVGPPALTR